MRIFVILLFPWSDHVFNHVTSDRSHVTGEIICDRRNPLSRDLGQTSRDWKHDLTMDITRFSCHRDRIKSGGVIWDFTFPVHLCFSFLLNSCDTDTGCCGRDDCKRILPWQHFFFNIAGAIRQVEWFLIRIDGFSSVDEYLTSVS